MKKAVTYITVIFAVLTLITSCSFPFSNKNVKKLSEEIGEKEESVTIEGYFEVEYDRNIIPENEKVLYGKGYYGKKNFAFSLLTRNGLENITEVPFVNVSTPRSSFYDQNQLCGLYVNKQDEGIIYLYDINTKKYTEILKEFQYMPEKQFSDVSYFKNNTIIAFGEYDKGFTVFDLNTNIASRVTVKMNQQNFYITHAQIWKQGFFVCCSYNVGNRWVTDNIFIDKNGNVIKKYKIPNVQSNDSNYMELSPDSSLLLYSIGKTGDNRYIYEFATETSYELYNSHSPYTQWCSDGNYFYLIDQIGRHEDREKWVVTKKNVKDIIINK